MKDRKNNRLCSKLNMYLDALCALGDIPDEDEHLENELTKEFAKHRETCPDCKQFVDLLAESIHRSNMTPECPTNISDFHYIFAKDPKQFPLKLRKHVLGCGFCYSQMEYYRKKLEENPDYTPPGYPS